MKERKKERKIPQKQKTKSLPLKFYLKEKKLQKKHH